MLFHLTVVATLLNLALVFADTNPKLKKYKIDKAETSVSGISAGGYFATQFQIAHSSIIKGAGVVAAGHYNCGSEKYLAYCMGITWPYSNQVTQTKTWSGNRVDPVENLQKHKVYLISGTRDTVVAPGQVGMLKDYYESFIPAGNIAYKSDLEMGHTFPTDFDSTGNNACGASSSPYISNCNFDGAGAILKHIYGDLKNRTKAATGTLSTFDQTEFYESSGKHNGFHETGYIYVPKTCETKKCRLHVVFHGCKQNVESIGMQFIQNTGYDRWADNNKIVLVFPQARIDNVSYKTAMNGMLPNSNGCFDWVGWYDLHFQSKEGKQVTMVKKMIDRVIGA